MNRLIKERLIRFAEGNGFEARTVQGLDGGRDAQLLLQGQVVLSVPREFVDSLKQQIMGLGKNSCP